MILPLLKFKKHPRKTCRLLWFCLSDGLNLWLNENTPSTPQVQTGFGPVHPCPLQWWEGWVKMGWVGFVLFSWWLQNFSSVHFMLLRGSWLTREACQCPRITERQRSGRVGKVLNKVNRSMTRKPPFAKRYAPPYLPTPYNVPLRDLFFLPIIVLGGAERGREELGLIGQWVISKGTS